MFARHLIESAKVVGPHRLTLTVRLNWYRSLPLSCIEQLDVVTDAARATNVGFTIAAGEWPIDQLTDLDDVWWNYTESARLHVDLDNSASTKHLSTVYMTIGTRVPYITDPFGRPAVVLDHASARVVQ